MFYNISVIRQYGKLTISRLTARAFRQTHKKDLPEINFLERIDDIGEDSVVIDRVSWCGDFSGYSFNLFVEALKLTRGEADLLLIWERGDSLTGLHVKDGVVVEKEVEVKLTHSLRKL